MKILRNENGDTIVDGEDQEASFLLSIVSDDLEAKIKKHYDGGRFTKDDVKKFVRASKLTAVKFKQVTGEDYI